MAQSKSYQVGFVFGAQKASSFAKTISGVNSDLGGVGDKVSKVVKGIAGFAGAYVGINALKSFATECSSIATTALEAEAKLGQVMSNTMDATEEQVQQVLALAQAQERVGVVQADVQIAGMQELGTYLEEVDSLGALMPVMNDMLVQQYGLNAAQGDAVTIGTMMGKVLQGQVSGLSRLGYTFTESQEYILKYGTEAQRVATLAEVIGESVGGMNEAMAATDIGAIQQQNNLMNQLKETVGRGIIPLQARFARMVTAAAPQMTAWAEKGIVLVTKGVDFLSTRGLSILQRVRSGVGWVKSIGTETFAAIQAKMVEIKPHVEGFTTLVMGIGQGIKTHLQGAFEAARPYIEWAFVQGLPAVVGIGGEVLGTVTNIYYFISDNWSAIGPIVYGVVAAYTAYKVITTAVATAEKVKTAALVKARIVTDGATAAQVAFNTVMTANPIGIVVVAIGALIAVGVALWQNWDTIKEKAFVLWDGIQSAFGGLADWFGGLWDTVKQGFKGFVNFIIGGLNKIPEGINKLNVQIPGWVPVVGGNSLGFSLPTIQPFAQGGVVTKPMLGMVGEAGQSEAIIPLPKLFEQMRQMIAGGTGGNTVFNFQPQIVIQGNASKQNVEDALSMTYAKFKQWIEQYERDKQRLNPSPA